METLFKSFQKVSLFEDPVSKITYESKQKKIDNLIISKNKYLSSE